MKPINKKERSLSFWRFFGLFFLAIIPLMLTLFLFLKGQSIENKHLRKVAQSSSSTEDVKKARSDKEENVVSSARSLSDFVTSAETKRPKEYYNLQGEISIKISDLSSAISKLPIPKNASDSLLQELCSYLSISANRLNNMVGNLGDKHEECLEDNDDLEKDLRECQDDLRLYQ
jgi:hypothetical protein